MLRYNTAEGRLKVHLEPFSYLQTFLFSLFHTRGGPLNKRVQALEHKQTQRVTSLVSLCDIKVGRSVLGCKARQMNPDQSSLRWCGNRKGGNRVGKVTEQLDERIPAV